jgi:hypothetical protein
VRVRREDRLDRKGIVRHRRTVGKEVDMYILWMQLGFPGLTTRPYITITTSLSIIYVLFRYDGK